MTKREFIRIARRAIAGLPRELRAHAEDCVLTVKRRPSRALRREMGLRADDDLFGLYEGPALTEGSLADAPEMPPRLILFYQPLLEACATEKELRREIRVTVLHEIGHHFGLDEERLDELGFG